MHHGYLLYTLLALICLSSCSSTYYYSTLSTNDDGINRDGTGAFIFETDSIQIAYSFRGKNGPIQISVQNKLDKPMYVDWSRSAIIIEDMATSYKGGKLRITSETNSQNIHIEDFPHTDFSTTKTTSNGHEYVPEYVSFIPPMRKIGHCSLWLSNLNFDYIDKKEYINGSIQNDANQQVKVKTLHFSEETSPLFFESYLTVFLEDGSTYAITQSFYIANLIRTKNLNPSELSKKFSERKDLMFTTIEANNKGWEIAAIGGIILGTTILDTVLDTRYH